LELRAAAGVVEREVGGAGSVAVAMGIRSRREEGRAVVVGPATGTCRHQEEEDGNPAMVVYRCPLPRQAAGSSSSLT
jgi:hypothetical protein